MTNENWTKLLLPMVDEFNNKKRTMAEMHDEKTYSAYHILTLIDMYVAQSKEGK